MPGRRLLVTQVYAEKDAARAADRLLRAGNARRIFARFEWGNYLCWAIGARRGVHRHAVDLDGGGDFDGVALSTPQYLEDVARFCGML